MTAIEQSSVILVLHKFPSIKSKNAAPVSLLGALLMKFFREPCSAAWVVTLCPDHEFVYLLSPGIEKVFTHDDFRRVYLSRFFPVESAWWRVR